MLTISREDAIEICVGLGWSMAGDWVGDWGKKRLVGKLKELPEIFEKDGLEPKLSAEIVEDVQERERLDGILTALLVCEGEFNVVQVKVPAKDGVEDVSGEEESADGGNGLEDESPIEDDGISPSEPFGDEEKTESDLRGEEEKAAADAAVIEYELETEAETEREDEEMGGSVNRKAYPGKGKAKSRKQKRKPKAKAKPKKQVVEKDKFGARKGTNAAAINAVLSKKPKKMKQLMEEAGMTKTFYNHLKKLVAAGFVEVTEDGYKLA